MQEAPQPPSQLLRGEAAYRAETSWRPWSALLATVLITVLGFVLAAILTALLIGVEGNLPKNAPALAALAVWQVVTVVLTLAIAAWGGRAMDVLSLRTRPSAGVFAAALALVLALQVVTTTLEFIFVPEEMFRDLRSFVEIARGPWWLLGLLIVGIGAPLSEELLFRGFLFSALAKSRVGVIGAALISTVLWTALHAGYTIIGLIEIFLVGLVFSWLLYRTGSLRVTIVCHAVYNSLIMLALRYLPLPSGLLPA